MLTGGWPDCKRSQSLQFCPMDFGPGFDEPLLRLWQAAAQAFNRVHREDSREVLVVRMKMRSLVLSAGFDEHADHDPEEPREFRHGRTLHRQHWRRLANVCVSAAAAHDRTRRRRLQTAVRQRAVSSLTSTPRFRAA